jgi:hypothetical protein
LLAGFLDASSITGAFAMDRRDRDLLNKQLGRISPPPRNEGMLILAIVAVFVVGMMAGASFFHATASCRCKRRRQKLFL